MKSIRNRIKLAQVILFFMIIYLAYAGIITKSMTAVVLGLLVGLGGRFFEMHYEKKEGH